MLSRQPHDHLPPNEQGSSIGLSNPGLPRKEGARWRRRSACPLEERNRKGLKVLCCSGFGVKCLARNLAMDIGCTKHYSNFLTVQAIRQKTAYGSLPPSKHDRYYSRNLNNWNRVGVYCAGIM